MAKNPSMYFWPSVHGEPPSHNESVEKV